MTAKGNRPPGDDESRQKIADLEEKLLASTSQLKKLRESNRVSAQDYRTKMRRAGYRYVQRWVPKGYADELLRQVDKMVADYEKRKNIKRPVRTAIG